jgi:uncharacterized membrane protein YidH (DUF202 family)
MNPATTGNAPFDAFLAKVEAQIIDPLITVLALAAFILFAYGLLEFIRGADNDEKRKTGQQHMVWGIIGLVIMFGAGTIVAILKKVVGVS